MCFICDSRDDITRGRGQVARTPARCCTCHVVPEPDGAEGDEAVVDGLGVAPALVALEHHHGHHEEQDHPTQVGHQVDEEAGTPLEADGGGGGEG